MAANTRSGNPFASSGTTTSAETPLAYLATSEVIEQPWGRRLRGEDIFWKWNFPPGAFVSILGNNNELFMHGFVYAYMPAVDPEQHSIQLVIQTLPAEFVRGAAFKESMHFEDVTDISFIQELLKPYGVPLLNISPPEYMDRIQLKMGATNYAEIMRQIQRFGKTLYSSREGQVVVTAGQVWPSGGNGWLVQGENLIKMAAKLTDEGKWNIETIGQNTHGVDLKAMLQPNGRSVLSMADLLRLPLIQTPTDPEKAQKLAEWIGRRQHGRNVTATLTTPSWRDPNGFFWEVNTDVYVYAPYLKIDCTMRIKKIVYSQALGEGTTAEIFVVSPHTMGIEAPENVCESGPMWIFPPFIGRPRDIDDPPLDGPR